MNAWTEEEKTIQFLILGWGFAELKRRNELVSGIKQQSTRTYAVFGPKSEPVSIEFFTDVERAEFERMQGERPEGDRLRFEEIPERLEDIKGFRK